MKKNRHLYTKKEFQTLVIYIVLSATIIVLYGGNTYNADYLGYQRSYYSGEISFENGLLKTSICYLFSKLGIPYQAYLFLFSLFSIMMIYKIISHYTNNKAIVLFLYILYPFFMDIVQIDNFASYIIVLYFVRFLEEDEKKGIIKYLFGVMIASLIHVSSLIYLVFLFVRVHKWRRFFACISIITISLYAYSSVLPIIVSYIPFLNRFSVQLGYYLKYSSGYYQGMLLYGILIFFSILIATVKFLRGEKTNENIILYKLLVISICFIPLILISSEFVRYIRNMWILFYIWYLNGKNDRLKWMYTIFALSLGIFLCYRELGPDSYYYDGVTNAILNNNFFW